MNEQTCRRAVRERSGEICELCGRWSVRSRKDPATTPVWIAGREWVLLDDTGDITPVRDIPDEESA